MSFYIEAHRCSIDALGDFISMITIKKATLFQFMCLKAAMCNGWHF